MIRWLIYIDSFQDIPFSISTSTSARESSSFLGTSSSALKVRSESTSDTSEPSAASAASVDSLRKLSGRVRCLVLSNDRRTSSRGDLVVTNQFQDQLNVLPAASAEPPVDSLSE